MDPPRNISITFCRAEHLPIADISSLSSDPYVSATLQTPFSDRDNLHSPPLRFRTPTERCTLQPKWDWHWNVGNVPRFGTKLHVHVMDEDCRDHDDRLGHVTIDFADLGNWEGEDAVNENWYKLKKKGASKKAAVLRLCAAGVSAVGGSADGEGGSARVLVRIEVKGVTKLEKDRFLQRAFTIGPNCWTKHYSPLIGKVIHSKDSPQSAEKASIFSFEANKLQLSGPVPPELSHEYVGFAPFVTAYFTRAGVRGRLLNHALHSQYNSLYSHDASTEYGVIRDGGGIALARRFLEMVHWSEGHRVFTYVITLDGEWHFTETGTEFAIDLLSKHSLHSDVSRVIAYSGEFFVQHRSGDHGHEHEPEHQHGDSDSNLDYIHTHRGHKQADHDPSNYELVIDNDSGTYRPNKDYLPVLVDWLHSNLRGLGGVTYYDCFNKKLEELKKKRKEAKHATGRTIFRQRSMSSSGSISSSDEEELETGKEGNFFKRLKGNFMMSGAGTGHGGAVTGR